jgi:WD40 repeat protein
VWETNGFAVVRQLAGHTDLVRAAAFSPDGTRILTAGQDKLIILWDAATGRRAHTLQGHTIAVLCAAFNRDGTRVVSGSGGYLDKDVHHVGGLTTWDARTGAVLLSIKGHEQSVFAVAFSPDGRRVVSASADRSVKVWDVDTGQELLSVSGQPGEVRTLAFSPNGQYLATGGQDGAVKVWDARGDDRLRKLVRPTVSAPAKP